MLPEWAQDKVHISTAIHLSWMDRLRVLYKGVLQLDTTTSTEFQLGRCETESKVYVEPIFHPKRDGYSEVASE